jgi:hypothetical protein
MVLLSRASERLAEPWRRTRVGRNGETEHWTERAPGHRNSSNAAVPRARVVGS